MLLKRFFLILFTSSCLYSFFPLYSVNARDMVETISSNDGSIKQSDPISIPLASSSGITINFAPSGEKIQKVWLDNPSFVTIDSDGCLAGLPSSEDCEESDASILYLRRINDLSIPGLPKTNQTLLTVVTERKNIYLFRVIKTSSANKLVFEIIDDAPRNSDTLLSTEPTVITALRMNNGFKKAIARDLIAENGQLAKQINQFIGYLETGLSKEQSAQKAGLSRPIINKLEALGR